MQFGDRKHTNLLWSWSLQFGLMQFHLNSKFPLLIICLYIVTWLWVLSHFLMTILCSTYGEPIPIKELADRVASYVHLCTLYWWLRFDEKIPILVIHYFLCPIFCWSSVPLLDVLKYGPLWKVNEQNIDNFPNSPFALFEKSIPFV